MGDGLAVDGDLDEAVDDGDLGAASGVFLADLCRWRRRS
jgi:hypothetical protein